MSFKPNRKTKSMLQKLSEFVEVVGDDFYYSVMGGISVDGISGKLTRNHPDVDFLIFRKDLENAEKVLDKLGYKHKRFTHPSNPTLEYKMQTGDEEHEFSFQIVDVVGKNKFEISFYRDLKMQFPMYYIRPPKWLILEDVRFPSVSKDLLIELKENELNFYEQLKKRDPEKYKTKRKGNHLKSLHDIKILKVL